MALLHFNDFSTYVADDQEIGGTMHGDFLTAPGTATRLRAGVMPVSNFPSVKVAYQSDPIFTWPLPSEKASGTLGIGFHFYSVTTNTNQAILHFLGPTNANTYNLFLNRSGSLLTLRRGTTVLKSVPISLSIVYHIESKLVIHPTAGSIEVRLNGEVALSETDINTATAAISSIGFGKTDSGGANSITMHYSNLYIWDESGGPEDITDWLGPCMVTTSFVDGDLSPQDWEPTSGLSGYNMLNTVPANIDVNAVVSDTVGDTSRFRFDTIKDIVAPIAIRMGVYAKTSGANPTTISLNGSEASPITVNPENKSIILNNNPDNGQPWTLGTANSLNVLLKRES